METAFSLLVLVLVIVWQPIVPPASMDELAIRQKQHDVLRKWVYEGQITEQDAETAFPGKTAQGDFPWEKKISAEAIIVGRGQTKPDEKLARLIAYN